jgi:IS30 family transposase
MYEQITIKTLHKQGIRKSQIARQLGCHRNTINNILDRIGKCIFPAPQVPVTQG